MMLCLAATTPASSAADASSLYDRRPPLKQAGRQTSSDKRLSQNCGTGDRGTGVSPVSDNTPEPCYVLGEVLFSLPLREMVRARVNRPHPSPWKREGASTPNTYEACATTSGFGMDSKPRKKKSPKPRKTGSKKKKKPTKADMSDVPADQRRETTAMELLGDGFKLRHTRHYSILFNTPLADVKSFGIAIELTYRSCVNYSLKLKIPTRPPGKKLLIYYFDQHQDYSGHSSKLGKGPRPQSMPGVYFPDLNTSMFYNFRNQESYKKAREQAEAKIEQLRARLRGGNVSRENRKSIQREIAEARRQANSSNVLGGDANEAIVQHEVAHQVLWNIGFHNPRHLAANPRWFVEGTAMMFEPISDGSSANFGAVNRNRLRAFQDLQRQERLIPVRDLVSDPHYLIDPQTAQIAYPQCWAMVHYLNRTKRKQVRKYVKLINRRPADYRPTGEEEVATFEKAFGTLDERWVARWDRWLKNVR